MNASANIPGYRLKDDLARFCLPEANRDPDRKLAWVNSICFVILLIGIFGARQGFIYFKPVPPLRETVPVILEPVVPPTQPDVEKKLTDEMKPDTQPVAVVLPQMPNIHFSVPTIGSLVVPVNLAVAPPLEPMRPRAPTAQINSVGSTGMSGDRPQPPYPRIALAEGEQGTVTLNLVGDAAGNVVSVDVKESSGFSVLDRSTVDFIKRHWHLPPGSGNRRFETKITYQLRLN